MKKTLKPKFILFLLSIFLILSCNDDITVQDKGIVNTNNLNVSLHNSNDTISQTNAPWLDFYSIADYENAINLLNQNERYLSDFENDLQFNSMRIALTEDDREEIGIEDDILAALLNPEGIIQIGRYIFKIDINDSLVVAFDESNLKDTLHFSIDDNAIDILYPATSVIIQQQRYTNPYKTEKIFRTSDGTVQCKVVYQRAAIYFSLLTKICKLHNNGPIYINFSMMQGSYTKNRNNATTIRFNSYGDGGYKKSYSFRPYSAMVGLKQFFLSTDFYYTDNNNLTSEGVRLTIQK